MSKLSAKEKLLKYLRGHSTLTVKQARARFGIQNVSARVNDLRKEGVTIYTNKKVNANGRTTYVYRLGAPNANYLRNWKAGRKVEAVKSLIAV